MGVSEQQTLGSHCLAVERLPQRSDRTHGVLQVMAAKQAQSRGGSGSKVPSKLANASKPQNTPGMPVDVIGVQSCFKLDC
jgi:hypothetical protein